MYDCSGFTGAVLFVHLFCLSAILEKWFVLFDCSGFTGFRLGLGFRLGFGLSCGRKVIARRVWKYFAKLESASGCRNWVLERVVRYGCWICSLQLLGLGVESSDLP